MDRRGGVAAVGDRREPGAVAAAVTSGSSHRRAANETGERVSAEHDQYSGIRVVHSARSTCSRLFSSFLPSTDRFFQPPSSNNESSSFQSCPTRIYFPLRIIKRKNIEDSRRRNPFFVFLSPPPPSGSMKHRNGIETRINSFEASKPE